MPDGCRAIVTNPPYGDMVEKFIRHGLKLTKPKAASSPCSSATNTTAARTGWTCSPPSVLEEDHRHQASALDRRIVRQPASQLRVVRLGLPPARRGIVHYSHPDFATPRILKD
jgi:hypothetical protein